MAIGPKIENKTNNENQIPSFVNIVNPMYSLSDLILSYETEEGIKDFLSYKECENQIFNEWGLSETHEHHSQNAINLYGAPGTGKTMAALAIAKTLKQPLIIVDYANLESKYVGETSKNISEIFRYADENKAILFFDEADAILSRRVTNMSSSSDVSVNQTRSVLLTLMNNHSELLIFATNFIENYDPAFMRRIIAHIEFTLPDHNARKRLWKKYIPQKMPCKIDYLKITEHSDGLSGSDIANAVKKVAFSAARKKQSVIYNNDFFRVIEEIQDSKKANSKNKKKFTTTEKIVSEEYVNSQINSQIKEKI